MELEYASAAIARLCNSEVAGNLRWGAQRAKKIRQRIAELRATPNLAMLLLLPACDFRPLTADRQGQYAVDALPPLSLVFKPVTNAHSAATPPLQTIRKILILEVEEIDG